MPYVPPMPLSTTTAAATTTTAAATTTTAANLRQKESSSGSIGEDQRMSTTTTQRPPSAIKRRPSIARPILQKAQTIGQFESSQAPLEIETASSKEGETPLGGVVPIETRRKRQQQQWDSPIATSRAITNNLAIGQTSTMPLKTQTVPYTTTGGKVSKRTREKHTSSAKTQHQYYQSTAVEHRNKTEAAGTGTTATKSTKSSTSSSSSTTTTAPHANRLVFTKEMAENWVHMGETKTAIMLPYPYYATPPTPNVCTTTESTRQMVQKNNNKTKTTTTITTTTTATTTSIASSSSSSTGGTSASSSSKSPSILFPIKVDSTRQQRRASFGNEQFQTARQIRFRALCCVVSVAAVNKETTSRSASMLLHAMDQSPAHYGRRRLHPVAPLQDISSSRSSSSSRLVSAALPPLKPYRDNNNSNNKPCRIRVTTITHTEASMVGNTTSFHSQDTRNAFLAALAASANNNASTGQSASTRTVTSTTTATTTATDAAIAAAAAAMQGKPLDKNKNNNAKTTGAMTSVRQPQSVLPRAPKDILFIPQASDVAPKNNDPAHVNNSAQDKISVNRTSTTMNKYSGTARRARPSKNDNKKNTSFQRHHHHNSSSRLHAGQEPKKQQRPTRHHNTPQQQQQQPQPQRPSTTTSPGLVVDTLCSIPPPSSGQQQQRSSSHHQHQQQQQQLFPSTSSESHYNKHRDSAAAVTVSSTGRVITTTTPRARAAATSTVSCVHPIKLFHSSYYKAAAEEEEERVRVEAPSSSKKKVMSPPAAMAVDLDASESSNFSLEGDDDNATTSNTSPSPSPEAAKGPVLWQTALDETTGRTYYYHVETRETQWHKPKELATKAELLAAQEKERRQLDFFAQMEANILKNLSAGTIGGAAPTSSNNNNNNSATNKDISSSSNDKQEGETAEAEAVSIERPIFVRTISSMETSVLRNLVRRVPSNRSNFDPQTDIAVHNLLSGSGTSRDRDHHGLSLEMLSLEDLNHVETAIFGNNNNSSRRSSVVTATTAADGPERQPSVGTFLATLPEESSLLGGGSSHNQMSMNESSNNNDGILSMEEFDLNNTNSFAAIGDESFFDLGVSEEESRALQKLSCISSAMACIKDFDDDDDDDVFDFEDEEQEQQDELAMVQEDEEGETSGNPDVVGDDSILPSTDDTTAAKPSLARTVEGSMNMNDLLAQHNKNKSSSAVAVGEEQLEISLNGQFDFNFEEDSSRILGLPAMMNNEGCSSDNNGKMASPRPSFSRSLAKRTVVVQDKTTATAAAATQEPATTTTTLSRSTIATRPPSSRALKNKTEKPGMIRRNTCGTLYVGSTMSAPDKDATIKCVCGVLRAHILQSDMEDTPVRDEHRIFNDLESQQKPLNKRSSFRPPGEYFVAKPPPPSLDQITTFYRDVFRRAQMEHDCIIMSLIYVERLIRQTQGSLRPRTSNWRSVLFSCMVLASKVWDDLSMWNADFSQTCPAGVEFSLARINELEIAVLNSLEYKTKVVASEYAKYYFLLRSMLIKSGLGGDDLKTMNPLDIEGAKRLQQVSTRFQSTASRRRLNVNGDANGNGVPRSAMGRSKSEAIVVAANANTGGGGNGSNNASTRTQNNKNSTTSSAIMSKSRPTLSTLPGASSKDCFMTKGKVSLEHMVHL